MKNNTTMNESMKIELGFLKENRKELERMTSTILSLVDIYDCTAPAEDITEFLEAINRLKGIVQNISIN